MNFIIKRFINILSIPTAACISLVIFAIPAMCMNRADDLNQKASAEHIFLDDSSEPASILTGITIDAQLNNPAHQPVKKHKHSIHSFLHHMQKNILNKSLKAVRYFTPKHATPSEEKSRKQARTKENIEDTTLAKKLRTAEVATSFANEHQETPRVVPFALDYSYSSGEFSLELLRKTIEQLNHTIDSFMQSAPQDDRHLDAQSIQQLNSICSQEGISHQLNIVEEQIQGFTGILQETIIDLQHITNSWALQPEHKSIAAIEPWITKEVENINNKIHQKSFDSLETIFNSAGFKTTLTEYVEIKNEYLQEVTRITKQQHKKKKLRPQLTISIPTTSLFAHHQQDPSLVNGYELSELTANEQSATSPRPTT